MSAYYNELDPYAAQWLRNLIATGQIAPGDVDERSIADVVEGDLAGYEQCHFFAGVGGWSVALRLAGVDDDRAVWTGSCPCQPLSSAGQQRGHADERHLWPAFYRLIAECRPAVVLGEQVASKDGREWFSAVRADLEGVGYAVGAAGLPACGVGAPHIRQRLWFVAKSDGGNEPQERAGNGAEREQRTQDRGRPVVVAGAGAAGGDGLVAHADPGGRSEQRGGGILDGERPSQRDDADGCGEGELGDAQRIGSWRHAGAGTEAQGGTSLRPERDGVGSSGADAWSDVVWLPCSDGKARPTQPGLFPLAHGVQRRASKLRAYGNAIVPQAAAEFIAACFELL